ncbi:hypothetical protein BU17DRAFT_96786 [Hysterangium stoloniferum]|nr:hypothetical protein BU17DRAFT_96786 [Hysterangium stoloniferum]
MSALDLEVGKDPEEKVLLHRVDLRACGGPMGEEHAFEYSCPQCEAEAVAQTRALLRLLLISMCIFDEVAAPERDVPINDVAPPLDKYLASGLHPSQRPPPHELCVHSQSTHSQVKITPRQIPYSQVHVAQGPPARSGHYIAHIRIEMGGGSTDEGSLVLMTRRLRRRKVGT